MRNKFCQCAQELFITFLESKELYQSERYWNPSATWLKTFGDLGKLSLKSPVNWNSHGFQISHFSELLRHSKREKKIIGKGEKTISY